MIVNVSNYFYAPVGLRFFKPISNILLLTLKTFTGLKKMIILLFLETTQEGNFG